MGKDHIEAILKWAVIIVLGYLAFQWFTGILNNVISSGEPGPVPGGYQYGLPYNPSGVIAPSPYSVYGWQPPFGWPRRGGRGRRGR